MVKSKKTCPICSKELSYAGNQFSKHGYQIRYHQHTLSMCFGACKAEERLVERYIVFLEEERDKLAKGFPTEWQEAAVLNLFGEDKKQTTSYLIYKEIKQDLKYFKVRLNKDYIENQQQ
jgi:hypothetical protein